MLSIEVYDWRSLGTFLIFGLETISHVTKATPSKVDGEAIGFLVDLF